MNDRPLLCLLLATATALVLTCDACEHHADRTATGVKSRESTAFVRLDDRLVENLAQRRHWPVSTVKMNLKRPTVQTKIVDENGKAIDVHAWASSENDFNTPMMRMDSGDVVYALSEQEWNELCNRPKP